MLSNLFIKWKVRHLENLPKAVTRPSEVGLELSSPDSAASLTSTQKYTVYNAVPTVVGNKGKGYPWLYYN